MLPYYPTCFCPPFLFIARPTLRLVPRALPLPISVLLLFHATPVPHPHTALLTLFTGSHPFVDDKHCVIETPYGHSVLQFPLQRGHFFGGGDWMWWATYAATFTTTTTNSQVGLPDYLHLFHSEMMEHHPFTFVLYSIACILCIISLLLVLTMILPTSYGTGVLLPFYI